MKRLSLFFAFACLLGCSHKIHPSGNGKGHVEVWTTDPAAGILFQKKDNTVIASASGNEATIHVDVSKTYQTIDGFGYCLTGGSAFHLYNMNKADRAALLKELFATDANNIGVSYLRLSIGASDLDAKVFSYNDLPSSETDTAMQKFSIAPDKQFLIPMLKEILAINPSIKILGSPWSPPTWMKTNNNSKGGSLKKEYYNAYAKYFVKYIQAMKAEGITIDVITVQNEPLHPGNNPSLLMQANEQADFIKQSLGPAFRANNIATKIIVYDHNCDRPDYPVTIYNDKEAAQYVDGAAFHLYAGPIDTLSMLHDAFPAKNLYFTEEWVGAPGDMPVDFKWHTKNVIIGTMRNWCKTALEWNLAANSQWQPHTPGGCTECLGAVTIDGNNVKRNPAYYIIAQASKFVRPGSVRIASDEPQGLANVAFKTTDGRKVLIVLNESEQTQEFSVNDGVKTFKSSLAKGAAATFVW
ncbi:glycoside hydrolase family 30 protein [Pinibacter aurantiacus]|uniref:Glucosylceramidase n=1 Tax=Pinibacter aurantiacus TaxID=2851599 RepID=A0A9E2SB68_9BACT|nr:glycoside hydrolase family 30 beta sandwich domain-containing protein [Pinibacter aurantiacus]MBV4357260.1 glucosylceramidase [Pinibacter aurantiacus]